MKQLKIVTKGVRDGFVLFYIIVQTHRGSFFDGRSTGKTIYEIVFSPSEFVASNGVRLTSMILPSTNTPAGLFVRGSHKDQDYRVLRLTKPRFIQICSAIFEYNKVFRSPIKQAIDILEDTP